MAQLRLTIGQSLHLVILLLDDCWLDAGGQMLFQSCDFLLLLSEDKGCSAVYGTVTWLQAR